MGLPVSWGSGWTNKVAHAETEERTPSFEVKTRRHSESRTEKHRGTVVPSIVTNHEAREAMIARPCAYFAPCAMLGTPEDLQDFVAEAWGKPLAVKANPKPLRWFERLRQ